VLSVHSAVDVPATLAEEYRRRLLEGDKVPVFNDRLHEIALLYPALTGTCKGKWHIPGTGEIRYVYGPCNFLKGKKCVVHHIKAHMCAGYPYYRRGRQTEMGASACGPNPSYIKGCGFNVSKVDGWTAKDFRKLEKLTPQEQEPHLIQIEEGEPVKLTECACQGSGKCSARPAYEKQKPRRRAHKRR